jgi:hypothetical protein
MRAAAQKKGIQAYSDQGQRRFYGGLPLNILTLGAVTAEQRDEALHDLRAACGRDA